MCESERKPSGLATAAAPSLLRVVSFPARGSFMPEFPTQARAVIIGGGVIGCSVAYHLGKLGWRDVVLLERRQLTCGTTWHAAGLIGQLRATSNMTKLAKYSAELYAGLEAETGVATGLRPTGANPLPPPPATGRTAVRE